MIIGIVFQFFIGKVEQITGIPLSTQFKNILRMSKSILGMNYSEGNAQYLKQESKARETEFR